MKKAITALICFGLLLMISGCAAKSMVVLLPGVSPVRVAGD